MIVKDWQGYAQEKLSHLENPKLEAHALLTHCLSISRAELFTWPERQITESQLLQLEEALSRRIQDVPFAYITGHREFWSLDFIVNESVLIPRPETEILVQFGLDWIQHNSNTQTLLDCGTGSGAIALAIASEHQQSSISIVASDASVTALEVAKLNARELNLSGIEFVHAHWLEPFDKNSFDIILSNPPYLSSNDPHLSTNIAHEPLNALVSGDEGLDAICELITDAQRVLAPAGVLAMEHGFEQGARVRELLTEAHYTQVTTLCDLSGLERVSWGTITSE